MDEAEYRRLSRKLEDLSAVYNAVFDRLSAQAEITAEDHAEIDAIEAQIRAIRHEMERVRRG